MQRLIKSGWMVALFWCLSAVAQEPAPEGLAGTQVYIVHGYGAGADDHWFPWLRKKLEAQGATVHGLSMPRSTAPQVADWDRYLDQQLARHDSRMLIVAHSLGCIAVLRHLSRLPTDERIGGVVLVSGFAERLPSLPQLNPFVIDGFDPARVIAVAPRRTVIAARDDYIVPYALSAKLSQQLKAQLLSLDHGGHLMEADGFRTLPVVYRQIVEMGTAARSGK
ncbi:RBBP9/YdeN family alpha/beta hydrolase [Pseudomonas sp. LRF_L74]|uniref:RBBP9/YdeN family alpha/beta hydrolase n=1 Tax=Pseudomonas sp. LRF_L74 TaxID=3369422 RepID=UPI003F62AC2C